MKMIFSSNFLWINELRFSVSNDNDSFSISAPGYWSPKGPEETINQPIEFVALRSQHVMKLHLKEIEKSGNRIEVESSGFNLAGLIFLKVKYSENWN